MKKKTILVTGASSGIGAATAEAFAERGDRIILSARRVERLEEIAQTLKETHDADCYPLQLDVTKREEVEEKLHSLPVEWREIDTLINNAGGAFGADKLHEADIDDWEKMIDTNIKGLLYVSRAVVPAMVERGSGHIINIGSIAGHDPYEGGTVYCGTKFFVRALSRALKMDLLGTPLRVSSIDPGLVETEFSVVRFHGDTQKADKVYEDMTPLTAKDIADAVLYAATRPPHVNISEMLIMPTDQSGTGPARVHRG